MKMQSRHDRKGQARHHQNVAYRRLGIRPRAREQLRKRGGLCDNCSRNLQRMNEKPQANTDDQACNHLCQERRRRTGFDLRQIGTDRGGDDGCKRQRQHKFHTLRDGLFAERR